MVSRAQETGAALLVRASRVATDDGEGEDLWEHVPGTEPVGRREGRVPRPRRPAQQGRLAKLTLRCAPADLPPPKKDAAEARKGVPGWRAPA